jgi:hypothetical protein
MELKGDRFIYQTLTSLENNSVPFYFLVNLLLPLIELVDANAELTRKLCAGLIRISQLAHGFSLKLGAVALLCTPVYHGTPSSLAV